MATDTMRLAHLFQKYGYTPRYMTSEALLLTAVDYEADMGAAEAFGTSAEVAMACEEHLEMASLVAALEVTGAWNAAQQTSGELHRRFAEHCDELEKWNREDEAARDAVGRDFDRMAYEAADRAENFHVS